jgi:hypothetical protein
MNAAELADHAASTLLGSFCMILAITIMNSIFNLDGDRATGRHGEQSRKGFTSYINAYVLYEHSISFDTSLSDSN